MDNRPKNWGKFKKQAVDEYGEYIKDVAEDWNTAIDIGGEYMLKALRPLHKTILSQLQGVRQTLEKVPYERAIDKSIKELAQILGYGAE